MNILLSNRPICFSCLQLPASNNLFHSSLFHRQNPNLLICYQKRWLPKTSRFCSAGDYNLTSSARYGGWDDNGLVSDSDQFRNFLVSVGIDHKRHLFTFLFGFLCALAISRVKVSSIAVFPASVLVFAVGFSLGFVRGGNVDELNLLGNKNRGKEEISGIYAENIRNLVEFFDGYAVKLDNLKCSIQNAIDSREITLGDLESYIKVLESNDLSSSNARKVAEALVNNGGNSKAVSLENHKPSRKMKDLGDVGFELLQSFGSLLGEKLVGSKSNKVKNNVKPQMPINSVGNQTKRSSIPSEVNAGSMDSATDSNPAINLDAFEGSRKKHAMEMDYFTRINITRERDRINLKGMHGSSKRYIDGEEYGYQNNRLQYQDNYLDISDTGLNNKLENSRFSDNLLDPGDYSFKMKHRETKTSFVEERGFEENIGAYRSSHMSKNESEIYRSQFGEEGASKKGNSHLTDQPFGEENNIASSSSMIYDDAMFNKCLMEANDLLKQAKDLMKYRRDEEHVEVILCQSASLLAKATTMKPMSLLAVGQLGNTYLLHGELKLRISRELRKLLAGKEPVSIGKWIEMVEGLDDSITRRDKLTSILINVCEECEELLVMAGRKYRMALSIDRNDVRALYNWGLALSFRAQLIADVGPVSTTSLHIVNLYFVKSPDLYVKITLTNVLNYDSSNSFFKLFLCLSRFNGFSFVILNFRKQLLMLIRSF